MEGDFSMKHVLKRQTKRYQLYKVGITYQLKDRETGQYYPLDLHSYEVMKLIPFRELNTMCERYIERAELISQNLSLIINSQ